MNVGGIAGGPMDAIEYAGHMLDRHEFIDNSSPNLLEVKY